MSNSIQTLYLSYDGMTDPLGQSQVLPYLIGLSKKGVKFHLISFEKPELFASGKDKIESLCGEHNIVWHPQFYTKRPPVISTLRDIWKMQQAAVALHQQEKFDIVHCRSYISALVGLKLQSLGVKFVFDMRGFWADERVDGHLWNLKNPLYRSIYRFFKNKERQFLSKADAVISLTAAGKEEMLRWSVSGLEAPKITVIPCCVDENLFNPNAIDPQLQEKLRDDLNLRDHFVVGYVGSIGTWYLLEEMLLAFRKIKVQHPSATFLIVTKDQAAPIVQKARELGLPETTIQIIASERQLMPLYISLMDCSMFFIRPSFSKIASSPTKQAELMAMGIPILCNSGVGDTERIIHQYHAGQVLDIQAAAWEETFTLDLSSFNVKMSKQGAHEFFSLEKGVSEYFKIYLSLQ